MLLIQKVIGMVKTRILKESNYKAIFANGKTIRLKIDNTKSMGNITYPEFYDVKITNNCDGNCEWCYQESNNSASHYESLESIKKYFGNMNQNQRPFQVAIGGGEPTGHPDFIKVLALFNSLGIVPNYTTNGMFIENTEYAIKLLRATKRYCGGMAISLHPHLEKYWRKVIDIFCGIKINAHIIIHDKESIDNFLKLRNELKDKIEYFVLLPAVNIGRAKNYMVNNEYLFNKLRELGDIDNVAFGANFYPELIKNKWLNLSLYEPEMFSKYLDLKDMKLYNSSFEAQ